MNTISDYDIELIEKFIDETLTNEENEIFQNKIQQSNTFKKYLELAEIAIGDIKTDLNKITKQELITLYKQSKLETSKKATYRMAGYAAASVSILILFMLHWHGLFDNQNKILYQNYYKVYPASPSTRSSSTTKSLGMDYYENGDYRAALNSFSLDSSRIDENIALYIGHCHLNLNEEQLAIESFAYGVKSKDRIIQNSAKWFIALSYLKNNQIEKAKTVLVEIISENQLYRKEAKSLLEEIK